MSNLGEATERGTRDTGQKPQARRDARSDAARWREWMQVAFPATVFDGGQDGSLRDLAEVQAIADELAHYLAAIAHIDAGSWDFTLDLGHMGQIDGKASFDAGEVHISLFPRTRRQMSLLRAHRESIELMAGAELQHGIILEIG